MDIWKFTMWNEKTKQEESFWMQCKFLFPIHCHNVNDMMCLCLCVYTKTHLQMPLHNDEITNNNNNDNFHLFILCSFHDDHHHHQQESHRYYFCWKISVVALWWQYEFVIYILSTNEIWIANVITTTGIKSWL